MQQLVQRRRRAGLVARSVERELFRANLDTPPEDGRHRFLFHVHGNAGVGKSFLLREFEQIARERGALTAYVDESAGSVPEALAMICRQFTAQGRRLKELDRQLAAHRERRHEAELAVLAALEPEPGTGSPTGPAAPSAGSMAVARAGLAGLGLIPGAGAFTAVLDPAQLAQGADRLRAGLGARFRSHEDVQLVLDPESALTPALTGELTEAATAAPWIVLFFDTYERTGRYLDAWLHDVMTTDRHGTLPATVVVVTAGQRPLDPAHWGGFADFMTAVPLEPFTEAEARGLLAARGVTAEPVVTEVLRLTGGLPVLVSTLAGTRPAGPDDVHDPSATAVERFLKWEQDAVRRSAALAGALPRWLDADVFRAAADCSEEQLDELYAWVCGLPFTDERAARLRYHDVVRAPMLRLQRGRSPRGWAQRQRRLAEVFGQWRTECEAGRDTGQLWADERWRELRLAESYHRLCAGDRDALPEVLRDLVEACDRGGAVAGRWVRVLEDAGRDAGLPAESVWGSRLSTVLTGGGTEAVLEVLLGGDWRPPVAPPEGAAGAAAVGAGQWYTVGAPPDVVVAGGRGNTGVVVPGGGPGNRVRRRPVPDDREGTPVPGERGDAPSPDDRVDAPLPDDDDGAPTPTPADHGHGPRTEPGASYRPRTPGAGGRDLALPPGLAARARRGLAVARLVRGDYEAAVADLTKALELAPDDAQSLGLRGECLRTLRRNDEAVRDLERAVTLDPGHDYAWASLGAARLARGEAAAARTALDRALELKPDYPWALIRRARVWRALDDPGRRLADLDRAVALQPDSPWAHCERGDALRAAGRDEEALAHYDRALALDAEYASAYASRGASLFGLGRPAEALAALDRALELNPSYAWARAQRDAVAHAMSPGVADT
ncbi:tetratricopeptide repeat protein [Streptomyces sp. NPDC014986]|uniref:tetratricopeptide repeat protein n=1 Tax=Streptomyces sp. NPDC014986 TaxID=3364934 RepID=UPI0036FEF75E